MKMRAVYIAIPVLPTLFGYGLNALLAAAITGGLSGLIGPFYVPLHIGFLILWFFSGWAYGKTALSKGAAILLGNLVGLVSLLLYLWQFLLVEDGMRNLFLSAFSQMFCTAGTRLGALVSLPLKPEFNTAPPDFCYMYSSFLYPHYDRHLCGRCVGQAAPGHAQQIGCTAKAPQPGPIRSGLGHHFYVQVPGSGP